MTLNLGCGTAKIKGAVGVDCEFSCRPDLVADVKRLPFSDSSIEKIYLFHTIEHIFKIHHPEYLFEVWRVLSDRGIFYISYPEFTKCAQNYISNKNGMREFWEKTIYGRQLYPSDTHISLMDTPRFIPILQTCGFVEIESRDEGMGQDFNTIIKARKGQKPLTLEEYYRKYQ